MRSVLEACDEARFSPGGEPAGQAAPQDAMLERAAALIDVDREGAARGGEAGVRRARARRWRWRWPVLALVAAAAGRARAPTGCDEAWRRGNEAYLHGDYAGAVAAYEEVDRQGAVSADLSFNLGDAYFRKGALGPAIWAFERALALDPGRRGRALQPGQGAQAGGAARARSHRGRGRIRSGCASSAGWRPSTETWLFVALYLGVLRRAGRAPLGAQRDAARADRGAPRSWPRARC